MDKNIRFKELERILSSFGITVRGGKGSEKILHDTQRTNRISCIGCHSKNPQIARQVVAAVRRKFQLDAASGVTDEDFYSRA